MNKQNNPYNSLVPSLIGQTVTGKIKPGRFYNPVEPVVIKEALGLNRYVVVTKNFEEVTGSFERNIFVSDEVKAYEKAENSSAQPLSSDLIGKTIMGKLNASGGIFPVYILNRINDTNYTVLYNDVQIVGVIENMFFTAVGANLQKPVGKKIPFETGVTITINTKFFEGVVTKAKSLKQKAENLRSLLNLEEKAEKQSVDLKSMVQTKQNSDGSRFTIDIDGKALAILLEKSFEIVSTYIDGLLTLARLGVFKLLKEQVKDCAHDLEVRMKELKD